MEEKSEVRKFPRCLIVKLSIIFTLILFFVALKILANNEDFCEKYSSTFLRFYSIVFGAISSFFPFSLFEIFLILTILYGILWIFFFIKNTRKTGIKKSYHTILRLMVIILSITTLYQATAGMEYGRKFPDIPQHTELIKDKNEYKKICETYLEDFNYCASQLLFKENGDIDSKYTHSQLETLIRKEFEKLDSSYFHDCNVRAKPLYLTSWAYRMCSITGVSFIPSVEANYNTLNTTAHLPFTIAHEIAHVKGAMPEEYANIVAAYICLNSDDPYIRFSGHNVAFWSLADLIKATNDKNDENELYAKLDDAIYESNAYQHDYWEKHGLLEKFADWVNDLYLKSNNDQGTVSYSDNIDVVVTPTEYEINSYSRYQALYLWMYYDK